jgi:hypothetical protein
MSKIHQQLKANIQKLEQIDKIEIHIGQLVTRLKAEENALALMEKTLAKEQRDVEILEKEGLTTMFRKFLGDREEKLEKEREDYLRASLRFNELYKSVELIRFELDLLEKKRDQRETVVLRIERFMKSREKELLVLNTKQANELKRIHAQADKLSKYSVEVDEAYKAGMTALDFVSNAEKFLLAAKRMGERQMWGGRRPGASRTKFSAIDSARKMAYQSRHALIHFGNELKDVYSDYELQFNMTLADFGKFANVFFDNLITDYFVQQRIAKSLVNITGTRKNVETILNSLNIEKGAIADKEKALEEERIKIIVSAEE